VILEVAVFHATTPSLIVARGAFEARTGLLLRSIEPAQPMSEMLRYVGRRHGRH